MDLALLKQTYPFLNGGGGMGELTRSFDWSKTPVGSPENWSPSLRITVSNLLRSKFPMFLWWGPEMIQFYNDAYRPSLGNNGKHPHALGQRGKECWPEIWNIISPLHRQVQITGEASWAENQLVPIHRNGKIEDAYWTYSYSSVLDEKGDHAGILVTCMETTEEVKSKLEIKLGEAKINAVIQQAPSALAICLFLGRDLIIDSANKAFLERLGKVENIKGQPLREVLADEEKWEFLKIMDNVYSTGKGYERFETPATVERDGEVSIRYYNNSFTPLFDEKGKVYGILNISFDVTNQVVARRKVEESEARFRNMVKQAPVGIALTRGADMVVETINAPMLEIMEKEKAGDVVGKKLIDVLPELKNQAIIDVVKNVLTTGEPFRGDEVPVDMVTGGALQTRYFNLSYTPIIEANKFTSVLHVAIDVTQQVKSRRAVEESEAKFRSLIAEAPFATALYLGLELKIDTVNEAMLHLWGKSASVIGKTFEQALPELESQPFTGLLKNVFLTGVSYTATEQSADILIDGKMKRGWFNFTFKPLKNEKGEVYGIVHMAIDVTDQVLARQKLEESEVRFRTMAESTPVFIAVGNEESNAIYFNNAWTSLTGRPMKDLLDFGWVDLVHPEDRDAYVSNYVNAFEVREPFTGEFRVVNSNGEYRWLLAHGVPRFNTDGSFAGYISACTDITEEKISRKEIQTALVQLRLSKEAAELGTFDMDLEKGTMHWDDRCRTLFGISHHQPVTYEKDFITGLHPDDRERILDVINRAFNKAESNGDYDVDYRTVGAEDGMVRWVRAKGKVYFTAESKPFRFIGSVLDITEQVNAIHKIEQTVEERTKELAKANDTLKEINKELERSNQNLEEFAHAASHDLKEPIRKIHFFTQKLKYELSSQLQEAELRSFSRIENASQRMANLIDDLLLYSHVSQRPHQTEQVDLNLAIENVMEDLELDIEEKKAVIHVDTLPVVQGYKRQLQQLFQNLLSNALKYSRPQVIPEINISARQNIKGDKQYHVISVKDNGIGFSQEYAEKIFQMFSRLHGRGEYSGTGVGLSIAKKVAENHNGFIQVESSVENGARFDVFLPA